jgi:hypothetical protein
MSGVFPLFFFFSFLSFYKYLMPSQRVVPLLLCSYISFEVVLPSLPCRVFISEDLFLLVVTRDVKPVICLSLPYSLLVLTTLHADHDSFHLVSSVRHTQPAHCTYYLGHHSRKCTRRRCMITVLPSVSTTYYLILIRHVACQMIFQYLVSVVC